MKLTAQFDPIVPGETDDFVFDYTADMGGGTLVSAEWTCTYTPRGKDQDSQSRILGTRIDTRINVRSPVDGTLQIREGFFAIASVGNIPTSAGGGTYTLQAVAQVTDPNGANRYLDLSADLPCQSAP